VRASRTVSQPFEMPTRPSQRARYDAILEATIALAAELGYNGVQMRAVAERSGIALGTVYTYFTSRDNMIFRATVLWSRDIVQRAFTDPAAPATQDLETDVMYLLGLHTQSPNLLEAFIRAQLTLDPNVMEARRHIVHQWWRGDRPNFDILGPELAPEATQILDDVFYAAAVRWAFGEIPLDEVNSRVRQTVRVLLRAN